MHTLTRQLLVYYTTLAKFPSYCHEHPVVASTAEKAICYVLFEDFLEPDEVGLNTCLFIYSFDLFILFILILHL